MRKENLIPIVLIAIVILGALLASGVLTSEATPTPTPTPTSTPTSTPTASKTAPPLTWTPAHISSTPTHEDISLTPSPTPTLIPTVATATATSTFTPTPPIVTVKPIPTLWWSVYSPLDCREDLISGRVAILPCLYQVQDNDGWSKISMLFYGNSEYLVLLRDLNRLENGMYRDLHPGQKLYILDVMSEIRPRRFPDCDDQHQPPCVHTINKGDDFNPPDTYETIAKKYFWRRDDPTREEAAQCIRENNYDSDNKPYRLTGDRAPAHITIPSCPRKEP